MGSPHKNRFSHQGKRPYRRRKNTRGRAHSMQNVVYYDDHDEYDDKGSVYLYFDADDKCCEYDDCYNNDDHAVAANIFSYSQDDTQPTLLC